MAAGARTLRRIELFASRDEPYAEVEVVAAWFEREVAAADRLNIWLLCAGETIIERRDVDTIAGRIPDVLTRRRDRERTTISRWLAIKDGPRMFLLRATTSERHYPKFAEAFYVAVSSFRLLSPGRWPLAERLKTFSRALPDDFCLFYPESWNLREQPGNDADSLTLDLSHELDGYPAGRITFAVVRDAEGMSEASLIERYRQALQGAGLTLDGLTPQSAEPGTGFQEAWTAEAPATYHGSPVEARLVVRRRPSAWFVAGLLGPPRDVRPDIWAINKRALAIVTEHLRTLPLRDEDAPQAACACAH